MTAPQPVRGPVWPFPPAPLPYPLAPPIERPVRDPVRPPADAPDALF